MTDYPQLELHIDAIVNPIELEKFFFYIPFGKMLVFRTNSGTARNTRGSSTEKFFGTFRRLFANFTEYCNDRAANTLFNDASI